MAILAGNIGFKFSSPLQFRVLLIPWVSKNNAIWCVKRRDYSSSVPVRYVPKKSLKVNEPENMLPLKDFERNELWKCSDSSQLRTGVVTQENSVSIKDFERNELRKCSDSSQLRTCVVTKENSVPIEDLDINELWKCVDSSELRTGVVTNSEGGVKRIVASEKKFQIHNQTVASEMKFQIHNQVTKNKLFSDNGKQEFREEINCEHEIIEKSEEVLEEPWEVPEDMKIYQEQDMHDQNKSQSGKIMQDAKNLAIKLLATRAFTAVEMRKKLNGKKFPPQVIEAVITDFQSKGLINDSFYAESFSRSRWSTASWGPRRIKHALFNKGVSETDVDKAIKLVFKDSESDEDQESKLGMSKLSMDQLFIQASKQWQRSQDAPKETRKSRIIHWLQYRGFNWGVTSFILKKLESQFPL